MNVSTLRANFGLMCGYNSERLLNLGAEGKKTIDKLEYQRKNTFVSTDI